MLKKILITTLLTGTILTVPVQAEKKAVLIGIGDYQGEQYDLEGPMHDIAALKNVLQKYWGFKAPQIITLVDKEASHSNILKALTTLKNEAKANDQIFVYFSGHGTSVHDTGLGLPLPYSSGALIPYDFSISATKEQKLSKVIIGKRDLKPILLALDQTQAQTFVAFDSCYSGNSVRGAFSTTNQLRSREMPLDLSSDDTFDIDSFGDKDTSFDSGVTETEEYPYKNIIFLSAANSTETAMDIGKNNLTQFKTLDNKPHGAFTDSLLRGLSGQLHTDLNGDEQTNYSEMHTAIKRFMKTREYQHESQVLPELAEDKQLLRMRNVLGKKGLVVTTHAPNSSKLLTVHLRFDDANLISRLKKLPHVQISQNNAELNLKKQGNNFLLINKSGDLLATLTTPTIQQIIGRVKQEAWKKQFNQILEKRASINIDFSLKESLKGNTAIGGEVIAFALRSEKPVYLLLLDLDSSGALSILYPYFSRELKLIPANQLKFIPGEKKEDGIKVQSPFGTDHIIAIGFAKEPEFLKEFNGKESLDLQSDLYKKLVAYLKAGQYGYNELDLVTIPKKL